MVNELMNAVGNCPYCNGELELDMEWVGRKAECPYCGKKFVIVLDNGLVRTKSLDSECDCEVSEFDGERSIGNDVTLRGSSHAVLAVIDQYEIIRKLGGGGFGSVYLAKDTVAGVEVAVKGLPPIIRNNNDELERIRDNFALVSKLHHPHIAAALHLQKAQKVSYEDPSVQKELNVLDGDTLMVMEYAPGVTLSQWRKQFPHGIVPFDVAIDIVRQIAQALDYAHEKRIIHRDIKPSNVMVETSPDNNVTARVLDFGLAAEIRSSMGRVSLEVTDTSGTRPYMAPEQWAGRKQGPATDQYALAALFCELVTGEVPFASVFETGDPLVMMTAVCNREVDLPEDCPGRGALKRALAKDLESRFQSCCEFADALISGDGRFVAQSKARRKTGLKRALLVIVGVAVGALALAGTVVALKTQSLKKKPQVVVDSSVNALEDRIKKLQEDTEKRLSTDADEMRRKVETQLEELKKAKEDAVRIAKENAEKERLAKERAAREKRESEIVEKERQRRKAEEELKERQRIESLKRICKQCHGLGSVWSCSVCSKCNGTQEVESARKCPSCNGNGERVKQVSCPECNGKGKVREKCAECRGRGTVSCSVCNGSGGEMRRNYTHVIGGFAGAARKVKVNCSSCGGSGRVRCWSCGGGTVDCSRCDGTGKISQKMSCPSCKGAGEVAGKIRCDECEDGNKYTQKECEFCKGEGRRILGGDEKQESFDGILVCKPMKVEYLPFSLRCATKIPNGWRAQFVQHGVKDAFGRSNNVLSAVIGEEIGETGWMFKAYDHKETKREVPGAAGLYKTVDVSHAAVVRQADGKVVKLLIGRPEARVPVGIKATLVLCGNDGSRNRIVAEPGASFRVDGVKFMVEDITMSSVTIKDTSSGCTKTINSECCSVMKSSSAGKSVKKDGELSAAGGGKGSVRTRTITLPGDVTLDLVYCPPGTFLMGSADGDDDEKPTHRVRITKGFWLGKTEVTQKQWQSVMRNDPSHFKGEDLPVESVSWHDCQEFCRKVGQGLRLPTEAEWEYACRAGTTGDYAGEIGDMAWYSDNSGEKTHPVGSKQPNLWGLYDMHGNVWEWCEDRYSEEYYASSPAVNPKCLSGKTRVFEGAYYVGRGGSWDKKERDCRSSVRGGGVSNECSAKGYNYLGFRVCCSDDQ